MSDSDFAFIYNPYTKTSSCYTATDDSLFDLTLYSYHRIEEIHFKKSDLNLNHFISKIELHDSDLHSSSKHEYYHWIQKIISCIRNGEVSKIIAARIHVERANFLLSKLSVVVQKLIDSLPNTFVYLYYINMELWLGASPELLGRTNNGFFSTISLAGTTHKNNTKFTDKERQEQKIVTDYISDLLMEYNGKIETKTNYTLAFGSIHHLANELATSLKVPKDFAKLIDQIHPSPALSGFPKNRAMLIIKQSEPIRRKWYCGHSIFTEENEQYSFANIRCVNITKNQMIYYTGAGITLDSIAQNEYEETEEKTNVLRNLLLDS